MRQTTWSLSYGATIRAEGVHLRVAAPAARQVQLLLGEAPPSPMEPDATGAFAITVRDAHAGMRYRFMLDGQGPWPDPCSRWQPDGVHGPSMIIDPSTFVWSDGGWRGHERRHLVCYELHVGTFTPEGTFDGVTRHLASLAELGVTAIELMPVAAFPGTRNWGYDGAALFAPSEQYGTPDALRRLVDTAHGLGLAVILDVVYNHLGPDGAYLAAYLPEILTERHRSSWGPGINLDARGSDVARRLICDNALHWLVEYHMDGLRLDATHALFDEGDEHLLAQLTREIETYLPDRRVHLIAEDERNLDRLLLPRAAGGYGLSAVWADDFHHAMRRRLAGDHESYFSDFEGTAAEVARAVQDGWIYSGQISVHAGGRPRGTSPARVPLDACVVSLQNHDQVGNRPHGERLHHQVDLATWMAAVTLLLTAPEMPLLFMGQEWAATTPFLFFTDHHDGLGPQVSAGRRQEFSHFSAFRHPDAVSAIPDPQAEQTWRASVLDGAESHSAPHDDVRAQTQTLLQLRRLHLFDAVRDRSAVRCTAPDEDTLILRQPAAGGGELVTLIGLGHGTRDIALPSDARMGARPRLLFASRGDRSCPPITILESSGDTPPVLVAHEPVGAVFLVAAEIVR